MRPPTEVLESLGYDQFGNNASLLCMSDFESLEEGKYERVSGDSICKKCKLPYMLHPEVQGALWLRRGCNGLVKI